MTDQVVSLQPDGTGKKVDVTELTVGGNTVERQRINVSDHTDANAHAVVKSTTPFPSDYGLAVRPTPDSDLATSTVQQLLRQILEALRGANLRQDSVSVTLASDERIIPVAITDSLDVIGTIARPVIVQQPQIQAVSGTVAVSNLPAVQAASVSGAVTTSPADTTTSADTRHMQDQLQTYMVQNFDLQRILGIQNGQFIPVPEMLPFLAA